ncbi:hypothetical protein AB4453_02290 [Vibrio atlanticus]|uniref:hypothetical protein n=1 Tax=Vibrio atlanticus TaxID=693153 RepID=UPI0035533B49
MDALMIAVATGVISSAATVAAIKVDIGWIKQTQIEIKLRISKSDERVHYLESDQFDLTKIKPFY